MRIIAVIFFLSIAAIGFAMDENYPTLGTIEKSGYNDFSPIYVNSSADLRAQKIANDYNALYASFNPLVPAQMMIVAPQKNRYPQIRVDNENVEQASRNILTAMNLTPDNCQLELVSKHFAMGKTWFVRFLKVCNGIPVNDNGIGLSINPDGKINFVFGNFTKGPSENIAVWNG